MRSIIGGLVLAVVLFVAAAASWAEAKLARRMADAHERLATLHYDTNDHIDEAMNVWNRLPIPGWSSAGDVERHRTMVSYWLGRYDSLSELTHATGPQAPSDPAILFMSANAAYRTADPLAPDRKAAIERLDGVVQAYADVLRKAPEYTDAAYNYELVSRMRDALAKAPPKASPRDKKAVEKHENVSVDLPAGPTIHGRPGGPPEGTDMSDFKTITPMRYDEREEQMDPGRGKEFRRKG